MDSQRNRIDIGLVCLSVLTLIASVYLQFNGKWLNKAFLDSKAEKIGQATLVQNDARRKSQTEFSWDALESSQDVFEGDSIFTDSNSTVQVDLHEGSRIEIEEQSLVVIRSRDNGLELNLAYGGFTGQSSSDEPILLVNESSSQILHPNKAQFRIKRLKNKKPQIQILSGEVKILDSKSQKLIQKLTMSDVKMEEVEIQEEPQIKEAPISVVEIIQPASERIFFQKAGKEQEIPVGIAWKSPSFFASYEIQLANEPSFQKPIWSGESHEDKYSYSGSLESGTYFVRVRPSKPNALWSEARKFSVHRFAPFVMPEKPSYIYRIPRSLIEAAKADPKTRAEGFAQTKLKKMEWNPVPSVTDFEIEIADNKNFENSRKEIIANSTSLQMARVRPGNIFWRVRPLLSGTEDEPYLSGDYWKVEMEPPALKPKPEPEPPLKQLVQIQEPRPQVINGPLLINPKNESNILVLGDSQLFLEFKWKPLTAFESFEFEISSDPQFADVFISKSQPKNTYLMNASELKTGNYFWRVRGKLKDQTSEWSKKFQFTIR